MSSRKRTRKGEAVDGAAHYKAACEVARQDAMERTAAPTVIERDEEQDEKMEKKAPLSADDERILRAIESLPEDGKNALERMAGKRSTWWTPEFRHILKSRALDDAVAGEFADKKKLDAIEALVVHIESMSLRCEDMLAPERDAAERVRTHGIEAAVLDKRDNDVLRECLELDNVVASANDGEAQTRLSTHDARENFLQRCAAHLHRTLEPDEKHSLGLLWRSQLRFYQNARANAAAGLDQQPRRLNDRPQKVPVSSRPLLPPSPQPIPTTKVQQAVLERNRAHAIAAAVAARAAPPPPAPVVVVDPMEKKERHARALLSAGLYLRSPAGGFSGVLCTAPLPRELRALVRGTFIPGRATHHVHIPTTTTTTTTAASHPHDDDCGDPLGRFMKLTA